MILFRFSLLRWHAISLLAVDAADVPTASWHYIAQGSRGNRAYLPVAAALRKQQVQKPNEQW